MANQSKTETILLDGEMISYVLERKNVKNINFRIRPETGLIVSASPRVPLSQIEAILRERAQYILKALHRNKAAAQDRQSQYPVLYALGEQVLYLGDYYTLMLETGKNETVFLEREKKRLLLICSPGADETHRKAVFDRWWRQRCEQAICHMCRAVYPIFEAKNIAFPREIRFRQMVSQWGNCRPAQGILTFNLRLLAAPPRCIEYVVFHEFTHFLYPNHAKAFYDFIAAEIPDWKELENALQKTVAVRLEADAVSRQNA